jgi:hypothetical protein
MGHFARDCRVAAGGNGDNRESMFVGSVDYSISNRNQGNRNYDQMEYWLGLEEERDKRESDDDSLYDDLVAYVTNRSIQDYIEENDRQMDKYISEKTWEPSAHEQWVHVMYKQELDRIEMLEAQEQNRIKMFQEAYPAVSSDASDESSDMFAQDEVMSNTFSDTMCPTNTPVAAENLREEELEECDENDEEYDSYGLYYDSDETESVEMDAYTMFNHNGDVMNGSPRDWNASAGRTLEPRDSTDEWIRLFLL